MGRLRRGWLEPGRTDPGIGLRAEIADPFWFLARQWELGEFQGEDCASPVAVSLAPQHLPLRYDPDRPRLDPTVVPGEALLEAEPGDWWTIGRRARLGKAAAALLDPEVANRFKFGALPPPYEGLAEALDGRAIFISGILAGDPIWAEAPSPPPDRFSTRDLCYSAPFAAGDVALRVDRHRGGDVDWFSVSVDGDPPQRLAPDTREPRPREILPTRLTFPGAPHPRWWQIEDQAVDVGGFAPDRSHLGTMLLSDLAVVHAEDWFVFPVPLGWERPQGADPAEDPPTSGVLVRLGEEVRVTDSFGIDYDLKPPPSAGAGAWSLYAVPGLDPSDLIVWPVAVAPQAGPVLDEIVIGIDEDANLTWAAELRADGLTFLPDVATGEAVAETSRTGTRRFRYLPMSSLPEHWHPYVRRGEWRQAVLADLKGPLPKPRPGPVSRLIGGPSGDGLGRGHEMAEAAVPSSGVRLQRRAMLARDTSGAPVLWVKREVMPVAGPPVSHLRWDVMAEAPETKTEADEP
jgi:hypothetical protein